jgi:hypothetical protein
VFATATALHRMSVSASREQIAHGLVDAAIEMHKLTADALRWGDDGGDEPRSRRWV